MATLTLRELIDELEKLTGAPRAVDLAMAAAGFLRQAYDLQIAVQGRQDALQHEKNMTTEVNKVVAKLMTSTVNIREE